MTHRAAPTANQIRKLYLKENTVEVARVVDMLTPSGRYIVQLARRRLGESGSSGHARSESDLFDFVSALEGEQNEELTERERTAVVASLVHSFEDFDVLTQLVDDQTVNDIIVRAHDDISIQKGRSNIFTGLSFPDAGAYKAFVEQLLKRAGKACTVATPIIDAALGANTRICVTHESLAPSGSGPFLTIRIARHANASLASMEQHCVAPAVILEYLAALAESGLCTLLIAGEVGTGKTTLVRALARGIPEDQALLIIEDTEEIRLDRRFTRTLLTRDANTEGAGRISPAQAIRAGMRMAMNRIILGEMRDAEAAESFIDVCASGHAGMSTIHAKSARDAVSRLELFLSRAQGEIGIDTIRRQISNAVSVIVYLGIDSLERKRRILEIVEVGSSADGVIQLSPMFGFDTQTYTPQWTRLSGVTGFIQLLKDRKITLPPCGDKLTLDAPAPSGSTSGKRAYPW